jgi:TonB family protein
MTRTAAILPLVLVLGCGSAPPPAAEQPSTGATPSTPGGTPGATGEAAKPAQPGAAAATAAPPPPTVVDVTNKASDANAAPGKATAKDAVLTKISQEDILAAVNKNGDAFNKCYSIGAGSSKSYTAKVTVKATVGPSGTISSAEVVASTAKNAKVDACVLDGFKKITFTRPPNSGATIITFPLNFEGMQQVQ